MADRGIDVVRAHLAKLPPSDSLTTAENIPCRATRGKSGSDVHCGAF